MKKISKLTYLIIAMVSCGTTSSTSKRSRAPSVKVASDASAKTDTKGTADETENQADDKSKNTQAKADIETENETAVVPTPPPVKAIVNAEVGVVFEQTFTSIALIAVAFEKNGEKKEFSVLNGTRKIDPKFKIYSYYGGSQTKEIGQLPITDFSIGKEIRSVYGDGSWSFKQWSPQSSNYIFTTASSRGADKLTGRATLLFDANSDLGKWIVGSKVSYRFFQTENRGKVKITLMGPYSKTDIDHNQVGHGSDTKFEIGQLPEN